MQKNPKLDGRAGKGRLREVEVDVRADETKVSTNGARVGDEITVPGNKVGDRERRGVIVSAGEAQKVKHLWVRWEDGKESLFIPFGGTRILHHNDGG